MPESRQWKAQRQIQILIDALCPKWSSVVSRPREMVQRPFIRAGFRWQLGRHRSHEEAREVDWQLEADRLRDLKRDCETLAGIDLFKARRMQLLSIGSSDGW
ncbi:hypothetical protein N7468_003099 [Penicillium chermesinum]|uniref:Uncharacterized protein n=1 Tax=Penicillium chermesinum TaxID=63820 RepID=A0A9W9TR96_9EURO|nr:uncharacterized protein N7468_003099 [Penicillium chermesinum]KAJ5238480.1 hypothetical protein N7468_003099 [Penicillium chermesinum]